MKKIAVLLLLVLMITGCSTIPSRNVIVNTKSEKDSKFAAVEVSGIWSDRKDLIFFKPGFKNFALKITNTSDKIIKIIWEQSSISYNNNSYPLFITGQKYIDSNNPMPPSIIPPHGSLEKDMWSSDQVQYYKGWYTDNINADTAVISLCVEYEGAKEYFISNISTELRPK